MAEGMQKKNLDTSPDETRLYDHGEMKTATIDAFKVAREWLDLSSTAFLTTQRRLIRAAVIGTHRQGF